MNEKQEQFIKELSSSLGIVSVALQKSDITRTELDSWKNNMEFQEEVKKVNEMCLDFVENKLIQQINSGELPAIQFYLKTKGKKRGY